jgi:hypothetical protein
VIELKQHPREATTDLPPQNRGLRRLSKHPRAMHHNRLAVSVLVANIVVAILGATRWGWFAGSGVNLAVISHLVLANFALAILIRQQYVVNVLFWLATRAPTSWPLSVRWTLGKVYHFGGLHIGGAASGTVWFIVFAAGVTYSLADDLPNVSYALAVVTYLIVALLVAMIAMALPAQRANHHNRFERSHRFLGWGVLGLFWIQSVLSLAAQEPTERFVFAFVRSPAFFVLAVLTISVALPWLRLKKVRVQIEKPSSHVAITRFDHGVTPFAGSSTAISRNPLFEWHSFANAPEPGIDGFRLTISRAGDWTGEFIDDLPSHVWVKGIPTAGVANIEKLFTRVVYVATGSGVGPVLPHLLADDVPSNLVWSTRSPRETYGDALVDEILEARPDTIIWNTEELGKPDMVELACQAYRDFDAEAVICISNKKLTWHVVYGLESRGIPAYGAIWDS